ncbi:unnamed protein product [Ilex paraguariensis]|uniref:Uncharacterized protein n=1 Tax=Ilex paraguariensis TaxID=185542 RepID=A0ABC8TCJ8_9AQUA
MSFHFSLMRAFYFRLQNRSPKSLSFFVDQLATQRLRSLLDLRLNLRAGDYSSHLPHLYVRLKCFAPMSRITELTTSKPSTSSSSMASLFGDGSVYGRSLKNKCGFPEGVQMHALTGDERCMDSFPNKDTKGSELLEKEKAFDPQKTDDSLPVDLTKDLNVLEVATCLSSLALTLHVLKKQQDDMDAKVRSANEIVNRLKIQLNIVEASELTLKNQIKEIKSDLAIALKSVNKVRDKQVKEQLEEATKK